MVHFLINQLFSSPGNRQALWFPTAIFSTLLVKLQRVFSRMKQRKERNVYLLASKVDSFFIQLASNLFQLTTHFNTMTNPSYFCSLSTFHYLSFHLHHLHPWKRLQLRRFLLLLWFLPFVGNSTEHDLSLKNTLQPSIKQSQRMCKTYLSDYPL